MSHVGDVYGLIDLITGYQPAMAVFAARRLGVFDALGSTPESVESLGTRLEVEEAPLGALLRALARIGLAGEHAAGFTTTDFVARHLTGRGDLALVVEKEEYFARAWLGLEGVVRTGRPALMPWRDILADDPETACMFLEALDVLALHTGPAVWELPELTRGRKVIDVGGGFGYYARRLAEGGSIVVLVDLPLVIDTLRDRMKSVPGVELVAADVTVEPSCGVDPASMDAALLSHLLHDRPVEAGVDLLRRVLAALRPGGTVVVNDFAAESGPGAFGPMFDLMMRVETGGAAHPLATLAEMVRTAGFQSVQVLDFPEPLTVLKAVRP